MNHGNVYVYYCAWIKDAHDKIALCVCGANNYCFWFNTDARYHGHGQLAVAPADHPSAITHNCFLDLSQIKAMDAAEIADAHSRDRGPISEAFRAKILAALAAPIKTLPDVQRNLAIANFS